MITTKSLDNQILDKVVEIVNESKKSPEFTNKSYKAIEQWREKNKSRYTCTVCGYKTHNFTYMATKHMMSQSHASKDKVFYDNEKKESILVIVKDYSLPEPFLFPKARKPKRLSK